jgi:hypothetical protein
VPSDARRKARPVRRTFKTMDHLDHCSPSLKIGISPGFWSKFANRGLRDSSDHLLYRPSYLGLLRALAKRPGDLPAAPFKTISRLDHDVSSLNLCRQLVLCLLCKIRGGLTRQDSSAPSAPQ